MFMHKTNTWWSSVWDQLRLRKVLIPLGYIYSFLRYITMETNTEWYKIHYYTNPRYVINYLTVESSSQEWNTSRYRCIN